MKACFMVQDMVNPKVNKVMLMDGIAYIFLYPYWVLSWLVLVFIERWVMKFPAISMDSFLSLTVFASSVVKLLFCAYCCSFQHLLAEFSHCFTVKLPMIVFKSMVSVHHGSLVLYQYCYVVFFFTLNLFLLICLSDI